MANHMKHPKVHSSSFTKEVKVVDLFCGIGGLTHGLAKSGLRVVAGIDNDGTCKFGYEHNNDAKFIQKDIGDVTANQLKKLFGKRKGTIRVLAGCAPCQPFSRLNIRKVTEKQLEPLVKFAQLIGELKPDIVSMENVAGLANESKYPIFRTFLDTLETNKYRYSYAIVDTSEYGVPQKRKRLVLLASRFGKISLRPPTHKKKPLTVRRAIGRLEPIRDGEVSPSDNLHRARKLSPKNLRRVKSTPHDGGNSASWRSDLKLACHKKKSGKSYKCTVYGRMRWDEPAPTMTTQCVGLGNGRFGHPVQDRAISLREAALIQTFPKNYVFLDPSAPFITDHVAKFIGNAVPVRLGVIIGRSIIRHVNIYDK